MREINWDSEKTDESLIAANVTRSTVLNGQLVVLFQGTDAYTRVPYDGRISLNLHADEQQVVGTYSTAGRVVEFTIRGQFADAGFTLFEGRWDEPEWSASVCIL
jgi:hypothetical protein